MPKAMNAHQNATVIELTEMILPQTDTPGAKAALVNRFVDTVLEDADARDRKEFFRGLTWVDERSRDLFGAELRGLHARAAARRSSPSCPRARTSRSWTRSGWSSSSPSSP